MSILASIDTIKEAKSILDGVVIESPLQENIRFSEKYQARVFLKREDLQHKFDRLKFEELITK